jgi:structural toxin protein (hemagglutinin/hemolysin) RtxA
LENALSIFNFSFTFEGGKSMIHLSFYVPETHAEIVKKAVFDAGGGRIGNYDHCAFEIRGMGQFRPLGGSDPFMGKLDQLEKVLEIKIELVVEEPLIENVIKALIAAHPYETPAYYAIKTLNF